LLFPYGEYYLSIFLQRKRMIKLNCKTRPCLLDWWPRIETICQNRPWDSTTCIPIWSCNSTNNPIPNVFRLIQLNYWFTKVNCSRNQFVWIITFSSITAPEELYVCHDRNFLEISDLSAEPNDGTNTLPRSFNFEDIFFDFFQNRPCGMNPSPGIRPKSSPPPTHGGLRPQYENPSLHYID